MRIRCFSLIAVMLALSVATLSSNEQPSDEYKKAMTTLEQSTHALEKSIQEADHKLMNEQIFLLRPIIEFLQQFWRERGVGETDDAIVAIKAAAKSISELSVSAHLLSISPNPVAVDGAKVALGTLKNTCHTCHKSHRGTQEDGSFIIK